MNSNYRITLLALAVHPDVLGVAGSPRAEDRPAPLVQETPSSLVSTRPSVLSRSSAFPSGDGQANEQSPNIRSSSFSPISLTHLLPDTGPLSGGEMIVAVGSGFSAERPLLISFGEDSEPIKTDFVASNILTCSLPPYHTAGPVSITIHLPDKPGFVLQEKKQLFTYENRSNQWM